MLMSHMKSLPLNQRAFSSLPRQKGSTVEHCARGGS